MADIVDARRVRNSWWHGWGIRKVQRGWMYNIAGYDAVELELRSGKVFRIGTDEPGALLAAIEGVSGPASLNPLAGLQSRPARDRNSSRVFV